MHAGLKWSHKEESDYNTTRQNLHRENSQFKSLRIYGAYHEVKGKDILEYEKQHRPKYKNIPACSEKYSYGQSLGWSREFVTDELER